MLKLADRVKETSITTGDGLNIVLSGAFGAFQTFSEGIGDGNSTYYTIENNSSFEIGLGTYSASNNTLSRDVVFTSSNNNQRIVLDGVSIVFCCYPASQAVLLDNGYINSPSDNYSGILLPDTTTINTALLSGVVPNAILPTGLVYTNDIRLTNARVPLSHTHSISDINTLDSVLNSKQPSGSYAASVHNHYASDIVDFAISVSSVAPPTVDASLLTTGILSDNRLSNNIVRTTDSRLSDARTPLSHIHSINDITNLQSSLDSKQAIGSYAPSSHQHLIADVSGLQSALNNKQASGNYAASIHSHLASDITDFASAVNTYAPPTIDASLLTAGILLDSRLSNNIVRTTDARLSDARTPLAHNHNISDITGLQTSLDSKQPSGSYAALNHTHSISSVSGLQSALDNKQPSGSYAAASHTHTASSITDFNSSVSGLVNGIYAPLSSPTLTGIPLTPTASSGTNTNQIASTSFVRTEISNLVASAPSTLDTLNELATALGNDPNFATTITNNLASKAAISGATFTGSISSPSGSFTQSLKVNGTDVSVAGHTHIIGDISGLQTTLDAKQPSGNYASLSHTHSISDVNGLQESLDEKQPSGSYAAISHNHSVSDVIGLQDELDGKQPSGNYLTSHPSVSAASSSNNSGNTFIQDLLVDSYGHITGISTGSAYSPPSVSISNYANNRLLTSDGTSSGIYAENKLTFDGSSLNLADSQLYLEYNDPENDPTFFKRNQITSSQINLVSEYSVSTGVYNSAGISSEDISISYNEQGLNIPIQTSYTTSITKNNLSFYRTLYDNTNAGAELSSSIMTVNYSGIIFTDGSTLGSANHNHDIINISGLQSALDGKQPSGSYALSSHTHTSSNITDFNSSVSGLLPTIANSGNNRLLTSTGSTVGISAQDNLTFDGSNLIAPYLVSSNASGDEGGEIQLAKPPNSTLSGGITIDYYQNKLRFFENGGTYRGFYLDLSSGGTGVSTNLGVGGGGGSVTTVSNFGNTRIITSDGTSTGLSAQSNLTFNGSLLTSPSGSFTNNLAIGSNNLTPINTLNIINMTNLYLWSNFR